jgi:hypothetical protein
MCDSNVFTCPLSTFNLTGFLEERHHRSIEWPELTFVFDEREPLDEAHFMEKKGGNTVFHASREGKN